MTAYPKPSMPPVAVPEALPELVTASCSHCEEGGVLRDAGTAWEHWTDCEMCGSSGYTEVCPRCKQVPGVENGLEVCGCATTDVVTCEICEERPQVRDGLCSKCFSDGVKALDQEASDYAVWVEEQFEMARAWNWL